MLARAFAVGLMLASAARAADIEGVLPASMDQPRIYVAIARDAKSKPLAAKGGAAGGLADILGEALGEKKRRPAAGEAGGEEELGTFAVDAFLDTGASGIMLSKPTAEALGIAPMKTRDGQPVTFYDVGVGGMESFLVTDAFVLRTCDYGGNTDGDDLARYAPPAAPLRLKIRESSGLMDELTGGLDVVGMPIMMNRVMVVDARPLAKYEKLRTSLVPPGDKSIPAVDSTIALTYVDYARFTQLKPAGAPSVTLAPNPMIGPSPFVKGDATKPIAMTHGGKSTTLTMLLDTGAASSMISSRKARELGIEVGDDGRLTNVPAKAQFMLPIGGIGGTKNVNGFFVDAVVMPVVKGEPIRYVKAPVLVLDISVRDEKSGEQFTLDGVLGMNYLVASASISTGLTGAGLDDMHDGAFDQIVIDHVKKTLGLKLKR
jgi:hypothetical protein